jgi:hypothetical protein
MRLEIRIATARQIALGSGLLARAVITMGALEFATDTNLQNRSKFLARVQDSERKLWHGRKLEWSDMVRATPSDWSCVHF